MNWEAVAALAGLLGVVAPVAMWLWDKRRKKRRTRRRLPTPAAQPQLPSNLVFDLQYPGCELTDDDENRPDAGITVSELSTLLQQSDGFQSRESFKKYAGQLFTIEGEITDMNTAGGMVTVILHAPKTSSSYGINISVYFPASMTPRFADVQSSGWRIKCQAELFPGAISPDPYSMFFYKPLLLDLRKSRK